MDSPSQGVSEGKRVKKKNPLVIMLCVLAGLALLYGGLTALKASKETASENAEAERLAVLSFEGASVISCASEGSQLEFVYADGAWSCRNYDGWPIDQNAVKTLEHELGSLKAVRVLEEHEALSAYGLDSPQYTVSVTDSEGGAHALKISGEDVNGNRYAAVEGDERVFTVASALVDSLARDILYYVDYETLPIISEDDVTALTLTEGENTWVYTRAIIESETAQTDTEAAAETDAETAAEPQYTWSCLKNGEAVEPVFENVESAIYDIAQISLSSCVAYNPDEAALAAYGLDAPSAALTVEYDSGSGAQSYELTVGGSFGESAESAYVMLGSDSAVTVCAYTALANALSLLRSA